ncbi:hypothetical protein TanjilG_21689 [Lupinus angustifolius]|uniref:Mediator of RNA polymerase II transcription subunit 16 n=1 Tax=Lupinus angustifolius TaxID=3871 RepID=A0A1J7G1M8_LUPAN|nr:hypothetical protein TanjilG_21689 [Lupinus angustifolius]
MTQISSSTGTKDPEQEQTLDQDKELVLPNPKGSEPVSGEEQEVVASEENKEKPLVDQPVPMEEESVNPATVFCIRLKQPNSNLLHKMSVPEICRNFSAVSWCGKMNAIGCAAETCARIPSSTTNPAFWIPIHIVIPERPTECSVFNVIAGFQPLKPASLVAFVKSLCPYGTIAQTQFLVVILISSADSPRDSVQFIEWSPTSCSRALLIANFHGRVTIWTQPSQGPANLVHDTTCWQREHEWRQDIAVVTKWLSGVSPYRWLSSKSSAPSNSKSTFEEKFLSQQSQTSARWPNFLCACSVFSSGSVQLHWSQWPPSQNGKTPKWFYTSKGLLGCGPSGIMAGDAIITESGAMHVAGVPIVNPSTVVVWEVTPGPGNGFQVTPKTSTTCGIPPLSPPNWAGFAPLAAYLFSWQDYLLSEAKQGRKQTDKNLGDAVPLYCSPVSNFSAYVTPEAAAQSAATTTWGSGVTAVAFDPTCGGSVIAVVIVEGQYMSPYDPDEGPSITGWRVQRWESSLQQVVLHPIFGNPTSSMGGQPPMQTVWQSKVDLSIPPTNDFKNHPAPGIITDVQRVSVSGSDKSERVNFDPFDLPSDVRTLARVVYSAHGGEIAIAFLRGGVHIFSGPNFSPVDNYQINVGSAIAVPAFSSTSCCSASVWHDSSKDHTILKIIRVLPPAIPTSQVKANSSAWERAIAERFWWSLLVGVDWWDAVGCTQSAAEDGIVSLNSVIAVLDADFHSLPSSQHRLQYGPSLDRIKCRLLEGSNAQEVRAMVLDMQARLLLDMLGKGIESALINPSALVPEPWQASAEALNNIDSESMAIEPALAYVDSVLDLASHFITRLRRYASFCRTLATHAVNSGTGSNNRNVVTSPTQSSATPATSQGGQNGSATSMGSTQIAWIQEAIAKISNTTDGASNPTPNPISGPPTFVPISINTGTFPGTPAVRLIGDCHFLHRLCQLLLFCYFFRRTQIPRYSGVANRSADTNMQKPQPNASAPGKVEDITKPASAVVKSDDGQTGRAGSIVPGAKVVEEASSARSRLGAGGQNGSATSMGSTQIAWIQEAIAKISNTTDGASNPTPNPISGPPTFVPISINTGTFPGTPAVRLIGDCHFLHRLCQLLLFCYFFRRTQIPRYSGVANRSADTNMQKPQPNASAPGKVEDITKPASAVVKSDDGQTGRAGSIVPGAKVVEEASSARSRLGAGNAGQGYTFDEVKVLFMLLIDLCRRTAALQHPLPISQVGSSNIQVRLHYIDGNYTVLPEVVEASLGPHMQNMPRPRGVDAAGLLLRELELYPPAEEWHRRNMFGGPWTDPEDVDFANDAPRLVSSDPHDFSSLEHCDVYNGAQRLWPRKRRMSERDAAFGLNTSVGLGGYLGIMGSRRDVVTAMWKTGLEGVWYKCIRCMRQTSAFTSPDATSSPSQNDNEIRWISRWAYGCPMCGGTWIRVV